MPDSPDNRSIKALTKALLSEDGMERMHAREQLVDMGAAAAIHLKPLLTHKETQVRWEAAKALSEIADPSSASALVAALEDDEDDVSWLAAEGLIAIGKPSIVPLLKALVDHDATLRLRKGAHHVFSEFKDPNLRDIVEPVYKLLSVQYDDINVMMEAKRLLDELE